MWLSVKNFINKDHKNNASWITNPIKCNLMIYYCLIFRGIVACVQVKASSKSECEDRSPEGIFKLFNESAKLVQSPMSYIPTYIATGDCIRRSTGPVENESSKSYLSNDRKV